MNRVRLGWLSPVGDGLPILPPPGLEACGTCGKYRGLTLAQWTGSASSYHPDHLLRIRCPCVTCAACGGTISSREPTTFWSPSDNRVGLTPGSPHLSPCCPKCGGLRRAGVYEPLAARRAIASWFWKNQSVLGSRRRLADLSKGPDHARPGPSCTVPWVDFGHNHYWLQTVEVKDLWITDGRIIYVVLDGRVGEVVYFGELSPYSPYRADRQ